MDPRKRDQSGPLAIDPHAARNNICQRELATTRCVREYPALAQAGERQRAQVTRGPKVKCLAGRSRPGKKELQ
jgi:hypothetical protein